MFRFIIVLSILLTGCSLFDPEPEAPLTGSERIKERSKSFKTLKYEIPRTKYRDLIRNGGSLNNVRMVDIYSRGSRQGIEYRLFDIQPGSVYDLLQLKNADVVVTADGHMVPNQDLFWQYLYMKQDHQTAYLEIKRKGVPMILSYNFVE